MYQKLFTKQIDEMLFKQYPLGNDLSKQKVVAKIFNPYGRGYWYLLNSDPADPDYIWAIVDLYEVEVGSVSRRELESIRLRPFGLGLERDMYFKPINAEELLKGLMQGKRYEGGGMMAKGGNISVGKIWKEEWTDTKGNEGYDILKIIDTKYFSNRYGGGNVVLSEIIESSKNERVGEKHEEHISQMRKIFSGKYPFAYKMADGGMMNVSGEMDGKWVANTGAGMFEGGGSIPNNYKGRITEDIWNSLTENQRVHFLIDHAEEIMLDSTDIVKISKKKWDDLDEDVQIAFKGHTLMGQYENGGEIESGAKMKADNPNWTNEKLLEEYNRYKRDLIDFNAGYLKPSKVIGGGYKSSAVARKLAKQWLEDRLSEYKLALEMRGVMADGGKIVDQYEGRSAKDIWDNMTQDMRQHFMFDHFDEIMFKKEFANKSFRQRDVVDQKKKDWKDLDDDVKNRFENHVREGQYADGGMMAKGGGTPKMKILKDTFNKRNDEPNRVYHSVEGLYGDYWFKAKTDNSHKEGYASDGINDGCVYMLDVWRGGNPVGRDVATTKGHISEDFIAGYNNKWETRPRTKEAKEVVNGIVDWLEKNICDLKRDWFSVKFADGGMTKKKTTFKEKVKSIKASLLKRKKVSPKVQKDYGKTYSPAEAEESAKRIAGSMRKKEYYKKKS